MKNQLLIYLLILIIFGMMIYVGNKTFISCHCLLHRGSFNTEIAIKDWRKS